MDYKEMIEETVQEIKNTDNKVIELISEEVHNAWMNEKRDQGFHSPDECQSKNHKGFLNTDCKNQERLTDNCNIKFYKWCDKCHTDLYPYNELPENIKEYDRVTVITVLEAIGKIKSYFDEGWIKVDDRRPYEGQHCLVRIEVCGFSRTEIKEYPAIYRDNSWLCDMPSYSVDIGVNSVTHWKAEVK